jgi:aspartate kinase
MQIKVVKFGGSSLADAEHFRQVASIIKADPTRRYVVPSAPGKRFSGDVKVTDMLYACYNAVRSGENFNEIYEKICDRYNGIISGLGLNYDISGELEYVKNVIANGRSGRDYAASRGEYLNGLILAKYLGFDFIDAENVIFFKDDGTFDAELTRQELSSELDRHEYAVIPGFYGIMPNGTIKTFSRGGSDITGSIVAGAADATLYENWTDVSGFMTADPRIVENPVSIRTVTYHELRELSYMGATVLHDESIFPVRAASIPINIKNTNDPSAPGTMIVESTDEYDKDRIVTGIAGKCGFSVITIEAERMNTTIGFSRRVLEVLEDFGINVEHIPTGIDTMGVVVRTEELEGCREKLFNSLNRAVKPNMLTIEDGLALIAVVGRGMVNVKGTAARVFGAVSDADINVRLIDQGSSELNIILGVDEDHYKDTIRAIYNEFYGK